MQAPERDRSAELQSLVDEINREIRRYACRMAVAMFLALVAFCVVLFGFNTYAPDLLPNAGRIALMSLFLSPVLLALPTRRLSRACRKLSQFSEPAAVGYLLEMSRHMLPRTTHRALRVALNTALPQMKESDRRFLADRHHTMLQNLLNNCVVGVRVPDRRDGTTAALAALSQVGDERSVPTLRHLLARYGMALERLGARGAAEDCLGAILARGAESSESRTLLRPAEESSRESQILVRPAAPAAPENKNLLQIVDESV